MDTLPIATPRQAGIYVRRARERQGLTRAQLAEAAGVSERLLASLELGDATGIRLDKLLAVFDALDIGLAAQGEKIGCERISGDSSTSAESHVDVHTATTLRHTRAIPQSLRRRARSWNTPDIRPSDIPLAYQDLLAEIAKDQGIELAAEGLSPFIGIAR